MIGIVHIASSRKGGKVRTKKGLAAIDPEKRRLIQSMGGVARHEQRIKEESSGGRDTVHAQILGDISE